ncbi:hypothetical protein D3C80_1981720 [compost metagenome]
MAYRKPFGNSNAARVGGTKVTSADLVRPAWLSLNLKKSARKSNSPSDTPRNELASAI